MVAAAVRERRANRVPSRAELKARGGAKRESLEAVEGLGQIDAAETDPEVVRSVPKARAGEQQHAFFAHELVGERVDRPSEQLWEGTTARARPHPTKSIGHASEEVVEHRKVVADDATAP